MTPIIGQIAVDDIQIAKGCIRPSGREIDL